MAIYSHLFLQFTAKHSNEIFTIVFFFCQVHSYAMWTVYTRNSKNRIVRLSNEQMHVFLTDWKKKTNNTNIRNIFRYCRYFISIIQEHINFNRTKSAASWGLASLSYTQSPEKIRLKCSVIEICAQKWFEWCID